MPEPAPDATFMAELAAFVRTPTCTCHDRQVLLDTVSALRRERDAAEDEIHRLTARLEYLN